MFISKKYIESLRHVEVQILRDEHGNCFILGLRDCSVQRSKQKLIEESGSTMLSEELKDSIYLYSRRIADEINYFGAGTVEFIHDVKEDAVYFMEMNTRLQVEHPVTEAVTGVNLVKHQIEIAEGKNIGDLEFEEKGYSLEVRINAEKAEVDENGSLRFLPAPGKITECSFPEGEDIQVLASVDRGKDVSPFYDSLIAQNHCKWS